MAGVWVLPKRRSERGVSGHGQIARTRGRSRRVSHYIVLGSDARTPTRPDDRPVEGIEIRECHEKLEHEQLACRPKKGMGRPRREWAVQESKKKRIGRGRVARDDEI